MITDRSINMRPVNQIQPKQDSDSDDAPLLVTVVELLVIQI